MNKPSYGLRAAMSVGVSTDLISKWMTYATLRQERDAGARFDIEGPILPSGAYGMSGDNGGFTTPKMLRDFLEDHKEDDIEIVINSPGGSVFEANSMVSDLTRHQRAVKIVVNGACFSAAADFLTIPNAERVMMPGSLIMIHNAWTMAAGDANELRAVVARLDKMNDQCAARFATATNHDKDELLYLMNEETWFNEKEAIESGLVDKIYENDEKDDDKTESVSDERKADETSDEKRIAELSEAAIRRANSAVDHRVFSFV